MHVNKANDKIIIAQSTHDIATGPMTHSKAKSTFSLSIKQTSEFACLLKLVRTHDEHLPLITLVSLGTKSHSPHSREKLPSVLKDFGDKSPCLLPMPTPTLAHTLDHQLECQIRKTTPIVLALLLLPSR